MPEYIKSLLKKIQEQPAVYIGKKSLDRIAAFLAGYSYCMQDQGKVCCHPLPGFQEYISGLFKVESAYHWASIIASNYPSEEEAFDAFYTLLAQFYGKCLG